MRRSVWAVIGAVVLLASPLGVEGVAASLPASAALTGAVSGGGRLVFRVRNHEVVLMRGKLPRRRGYTCALAAGGRVSFRIPNRDPIRNGRFTIRARQTLARIHGGVRRTHLFVSGQFDPTGRRARGTMRLTIVDPGGRCASPLLSWRIPAS